MTHCSFDELKLSLPEFGGKIDKNIVVVSNRAYIRADSDINFDRLVALSKVPKAAQQYGEAPPPPVSVLREHENGLLSFPRHFFDVVDLGEELSNILPVYTFRDSIAACFASADFQSHIALRDSQRALWYGDGKYVGLCAARNGKLIAAPGKGKTELGLLKAAERGFATLVLVTNGGIAVQWKERAMSRLGLAEEDVGMIVGGVHLKKKKKELTNRWERPLVIAIVNSLALNASDIPMEYRTRFGTVLLDEAHHEPADTFDSVADLFYGERFAFTADADRDDGLGPIVAMTCGETVGLNVEPDVPAYVSAVNSPLTLNDVSVRSVTVRGRWHLSKVHSFLSSAEQRNAFIVSITDDKFAAGKPTLVLCHSVEHPAILRSMSKYTERACVITGDTPYENRLELLRKHDYIFATVGVAAEGLDKQELECVLFATPFVSRRLYKQGKGRTERFGRAGKAPEALIVTDTEVPFIKGFNNALFAYVGLPWRL